LEIERRENREIYLQLCSEGRIGDDYFAKSIFSTIAYNDLYQKAILQFESLDFAPNRLVARQANEIHSFSGGGDVQHSIKLYCISGNSGIPGIFGRQNNYCY
jgi:hypothetical protein